MNVSEGSNVNVALGCPRNLADVLVRAATRHAAAGMYFTSESDFREATFLNHSEILSGARRTLGALRTLGLKSGSPIGIIVDHSPDFVRVFWACTLGGFVPCVLASMRNDSERWREHVRGVDTLLHRPIFVCDEELLSEMPDSVTCVGCRGLDSVNPAEILEVRQAAGPAMLMLTSGSTGKPKAVALTHENVISSVVAKVQSRRFTPEDVVFNWIGFDHVVALIEAHILGVYLGVNQINASPRSILADPLRFLRIIDHYRVTTTFTPNFLLGKICSDLRSRPGRNEQSTSDRWDFTCVRHVFSGGEANSVATGREFLELLAPFGLSRNGLLPGYGMTETCAGATYSDDFHERDAGMEFASVGVPASGFDVRIVDDQGQVLSAGREGHLQVRGPMVFKKYYNNDEATASAFTPDEWFRTGDMARSQGGRLFLVGRSKDSIIVSGVNYFSQELEIALQQLNGIDPAHIAAFPTRGVGADTEQLVVAFSTNFTGANEAALFELVLAIRTTTIMLWGFRPSLVIALSKDVFPKTNLGKIQRSLMRRKLEAGDFSREVDAVNELIKRHRGKYVKPDGDVERRMVSMIAGLLGTDETTLSVTESFFDLGGTSLEILQLTRLLEASFGVDVTLATVLQNPTVRALSKLTEHSVAMYDPTVTLQRSGARAPLFLVHPGDGGTFVFVNLAKYFVGERPVFALRPRGFNPGEGYFETFEEMVGCYVDAIRNVQPVGPYVLVGYSLGASIAFEMAKLLERSGETIGFLGCIDGIPCGEEAPPAFGVAMLDAAHLLSTVHKRHLAAWSRMVKSMQHLSRTHELTGMVDEMIVFRTAGLPKGADGGRWGACLEGWNKYVRKIKYVDVPGDHMTVIAPKYVVRFHTILRGQLRESEAAAGEFHA